MIEIKEFNKSNQLTSSEKSEISTFLFQNLEKYGDPQTAIEKAMDYALGLNDHIGGHIFVARDNGTIAAATVINKTGMNDYIPANILVYIATHRDYRGKGIGKQLMKTAIENTEGDIALHVEPDNPAKGLYEKLGFTNKYLEMRLIKETK